MSGAAIDAARLIVITDHQRWSEEWIEQRVTAICQITQPGSVVVQLRDREMLEVDRLRIGQRLRRITTNAQQMFVISDRIDLAVLLGADGVALPMEGIEAKDARSLLLRKGVAAPWISCAWHDVTQLPDSAASVCVLSPIAEARKGRPALGLDQLTRFRQQLPAPQRLFALGGVAANNAAACLAAGAQGVAVMAAAFDADPLPLLGALGIRA